MNQINKNPDKIIDGLFLSGFYEARQKDILKNLGITHILITADCLSKYYPDVWNYQIRCLFTGNSRSLMTVLSQSNTFSMSLMSLIHFNLVSLKKVLKKVESLFTGT